MPVTIEPALLSSEPARRLMAELDAELTGRYPDPADNHLTLAAAEVTADQGVFLVARLDGEPVGCGALRRIAPTVGEVKRMYVVRAARGNGIGSRLLAELERHAHRLGLRQLVLETGERQPEAIALYQRSGFDRIAPFGDYLDSPASVCMGKPILDPDAG